MHNLFFQHYSEAVDWEVVLSMWLGWNSKEQALLLMLGSVERLFINRDAGTASMATVG